MISFRAGRLRSGRVAGAIVVLLAAGGTAVAATQGADPTGAVQIPADQMTVTIPTAVSRSNCADTKLTGPGTTVVPYTAKQTSALTFALQGDESNDWDIALFDHASGRRLTGSGAFGAHELAQAFAVAGQQFDLQVCRVSGSAKSEPLAIEGVTLPAAVDLPAAASTESLVHITVPNLKAYSTLNALGIDMVEDASAAGVTAVLHGAHDGNLLAKAGFQFTTLVPDLAAADRQERAQDAKDTAADGAAGSALPSHRTTYRTLADVDADIKSVIQAHPAIAKPVTLPVKTFQGRDTIGVELSSDVNATDDQKPISFIMGLHHAREWPAAEMPTEFAIYLANGYGTDPEITRLLNTTRVVIVPVINGDGYVASRETPDPADTSGDPAGAPSLAESVGPPEGGALAYRRKNCDGASPSPLTPCNAQYGIDPNRNYGFNWGGLGASSSTDQQTYRGTGPWSEPETQAVHEYSQDRPINSLLTVHNFASLVLRPPGTSGNGLAPDEARLKAVGDSMAADTGYTSEYSYQLYDTSGTTEDWNYGAAGTYGYTIELGPASDQGGNFHIAYEQAVVNQWTGTGPRAGHGMRAAMMTLAETASSQKDFSTVAGRAPAGRIIHLRKVFKTSTSPVCMVADPTAVAAPGGATDCVNPGDPILVDDHLDYKTRVPVNGRFAWLVPPSTHPFVAKKGGTEAYTMTCEDASGHVYSTQDVTIARNQREEFTLPCGGTIPTVAPVPTSTVTTTVTMPAPGTEGTTPVTPAPGTSTTTVTTPGAADKDKAPPQSRFTRGGLLATRAGVQLAGTSADFAPADIEPHVTSVRVALGLQTGKLCRWATAAGTLGKKTSCKRTPYLPAMGTQTWTFLYQHKLPAGHYIAWIRARDAAGNIEPKAKSHRNLLKFLIK